MSGLFLAALGLCLDLSYVILFLMCGFIYSSGTRCVTNQKQRWIYFNPKTNAMFS